MRKYLILLLVSFILLGGSYTTTAANDVSASSLIQDVKSQLEEIKDFKGKVETEIKVGNKKIQFATKVMKSAKRFMTQNVTTQQKSIPQEARMLNAIPWLYLPPDYSAIMELLPLEGQLDYQDPLQKLDKLYELELLGEAVYKGQEVYMIQLKNAFSNQRFYIDKTRKTISRIEIFNSSNIKVANINYTNFKLYQDQIWLPRKIRLRTGLDQGLMTINLRDWQVNVGLTNFDFAQGFQDNYQVKVNKLQDKLQKQPQNDQLYWQISQVYEENNKLDKAISNLKNAIEIRSKLKYKEKLVRLLQREGRYQEALTEAKTALQINYNNPQFHYLLGKVKLQLKEIKEARYYLEKAVEYAPQNVTYLEELFWVYYNLADKSDSYLLERAEKTIKKLITLQDTNQDYRIYLGDIYFAQDKLVKAAKAYNKAVSLAPQDTWGYIKLAKFYKKTGRYDKAEELYRYIIYLDDSLENRRRLASLYFELQKYELAVEEYQIIDKRSSEDIDLKFKLIESYLAMGDKKAAKEIIEKIFQKHKQGEVYLELAEIIERYDLTLAVTIYQQALDNKDILTTQQQNTVYQAINRILYNQEKILEAKLLREAVVLQSQADIYQILGKYQLTAGNLETAINNFKSALKIDNTIANHYNLAVSYLLADKFKLATAQAEKLAQGEALLKAQDIIKLKQGVVNLQGEYKTKYVPGRVNSIKGKKLRQQGQLKESLVKYQAALFENYDYQLAQFYIVLIQKIQGNDLAANLAQTDLEEQTLALAKKFSRVLEKVTQVDNQ
ncbi:DUF4292 domain-containing protein [Halanaerobaculum tunisiense]